MLTRSAGLGIALLKLNNKAESSDGESILQAMSVIATLWPILFAAVVGPLVKAVALYKAEKGTKLGVHTRSKTCTCRHKLTLA